MGAESQAEDPKEISAKSKITSPENIRRIIYLLIAVFVLELFSIVPTPLEIEAQRALGVLAFVTILWVTEAFPLGMTALFGITLLPILNVVKIENSFVGFKNPALFFLIGALSFGIAMQRTNLHKRFALKLLNKFGTSSSMIIFSVCLLGSYMSMTMPCHAVAALLLPVLVMIVESGDIKPKENFGTALFLGLTYSTSVGSIGTLLGGARNILAIGIFENLTQQSLSFLDWAIAGIPIASVLTLLTFATLKMIYPWGEIDTDKIRNGLKKEVEEMGSISRGEKKAAIIFFTTFILWITVGRELGLSIVAIGGFFALVITRTINWQDIKNGMPWGLIFLYGGALTLSNALVETDALEFFSENLVAFMGKNPLIIMIAFLGLVIIVSNLMSNSAATAVILPIALATFLTLEAGSYTSQVVVFLIAMGSAMVFMLPIGTPSAAIVYSAGYVDMKDLIKAGAILTVISLIAFITVGLGWWKLIGLW